MLNFSKWSLKQYLRLIQNREHFTLSKFGDGELACLFQYIGYPEVNHFGNKNIDGHEYFTDMAIAYHESFLNEQGYMKMTDPKWLGAVHQFHGQPLFTRYARQFGIDVSKINFHDHRWMYDGASNGKLGPLKEELEKRNFIIVSEPRKRKLNIKHVDFLETPAVNSWLEKDRIIQTMKEMTDHYEDPVFGVMCGMSALAIQDIAYRDIGDRATMISFGSIFDPYMGHPTRILHRSYKVLEI